MKIKNAIFVKGVRGSDELIRQNKLQIAFYGRSNVGKSSSINALLRTKKLVKSSAKPGKTKELNIFEINQKFFIIDLPGYGYAKISEKEREKLRKLIRWYLFDAEVIRRVNILILDAKVGLTDLDREMLFAFENLNEPVIILLNKIDKLKQADLSKNFKKLKVEVREKIKIIKFSAMKKKGVEEFWVEIKKKYETEI